MYNKQKIYNDIIPEGATVSMDRKKFDDIVDELIKLRDREKEVKEDYIKKVFGKKIFLFRQETEGSSISYHNRFNFNFDIQNIIVSYDEYEYEDFIKKIDSIVDENTRLKEKNKQLEEKNKQLEEKTKKIRKSFAKNESRIIEYNELPWYKRIFKLV